MRRQLWMLLAVIALAGCSSGATATTPPPTQAPTATAVSTQPPAETVNFRFDWTPTANDIPVLAADAQGYFKDENLTVNETVGSGSSDAETLTGAGKFDMAIANALTVVVGAEQGIPVESVGVIQQTDPDGVISLPSKPINKPQDLIGTKFGAQQSSNGYLFYKALLQKEGIDQSKITEVPIGFDIAPLVNHQVDSLLAFKNNELLLVEAATKAPAVFMGMTDYGINPYGQTIIVNKTFAQQHLHAVKAFLKAYARGIQWAIHNPAAAVDLFISKNPALDKAEVTKEMGATLALMTSSDTATNGLLTQTLDRWQSSTIDFAKSAGLIKSAVKASDIASVDFLPNPPITQAIYTP